MKGVGGRERKDKWIEEREKDGKTVDTPHNCFYSGNEISMSLK